MPPKTRKDAFEAYYRANPEKLKGKTVDEAYAAMRREAGRKRLANRSAGNDSIQNAIARRVEKKTPVAARGRNGAYNVNAFQESMKESRETRKERRNEGSLGEQWARDKKKISRFFKGPENRKTSTAVRTDPRAAYKPPAKMKIERSDSGFYQELERRYTGKGNLSEDQKLAIARRLKNKSTKGGRQA